MRLWFGLYLIGVAVAIAVFYDEDDFWFLPLGILWPVLLAGAMVGTFTGSLALLLEKLTKRKPHE